MREAARRQAALAYYSNRSPPPRFRPGIIIAAVIITGILVIGIIMTIVAYLPGYAAIGVEALRIASPIIFALGALMLIGLIFLVCIRSSRERQLFEKNLHEISTASRATLASRRSVASSTPSVSAQPQKSILKQGSTSTYNGGRNSQYSQQSSAASSFEGSTGSQGRVHYNNVSMKPDPYTSQALRGGPQVKNPNKSYGSQGSMDGELRAKQQAPLQASRPRGGSSTSETNSRRSTNSYDNGAYDSYDPNSVAGQGMLTPRKQEYPGNTSFNTSEIRAASPASTTTSNATPRRWGQSGHNTSQGSMGAYSDADQSREKVSVVTELYRDIQPGAQQSQTTTVTTTRHYEKQHPSVQPPPRPAKYQQPPAMEPTGSTEV